MGTEPVRPPDRKGLALFAEKIVLSVLAADKIIERVQCNYGLNEKYRNDLSDGKLRITGFDEDDNARIIEIPNHRFLLRPYFYHSLLRNLACPIR